jgi:hypothetical protein
VYLHTFLTSALDGGQCSASHTAALALRKVSVFPLARRVGLDAVEKKIRMLLPRIEPQFVGGPVRTR